MKSIPLAAVLSLFHCIGSVQMQAVVAPTCSAYNYRFSLSLKLCQAQTASGVVTQLSKEDSKKITELYPNLFQTHSYKQPSRVTIPWSGYRQSCCKTYESHTPYTHLINVDDEERELVQLENAYQYVREGHCGGICPWNYDCVTQKSVHYFMVWDDSSETSELPYTFDAFEIPTYCECFRKSFGWFWK